MNTTSMYSAVMGNAFSRLAAPVRQFHTASGHQTFDGEVDVQAPSSFLAKLLAIALGAPLRASSGVIRFELRASPDVEVWTRFFPGKTMHSTLQKSGDRITERLGASLLTFRLLEINGALEMRLEELHFLGILCPTWLMPKVTARETGSDRKLHFQVHADVPRIGRVASYTGYLTIPAGAV